ncbi:MAG: pyridoxamine 5'-phosphate oxidase family protein [Oscillospiraceae bacterium]
MIRKEREVTDFNEKIKIIEKCNILRMAMVDNGKPYIVPLNFGYVVDGEKLELYFHTAKKGMKMDILALNPNVCFEMDCEHKLLADEIACKNTFLFESVLGNGYIEFIENPSEKVNGLNILMKHQTGKTFEIPEKATAGIAVGKIVVTELFGKARKKK